MIGAAYEADVLGLQGPYSAVFESLHLGWASVAPARARRALSKIGTPDQTEVDVHLTGLGTALSLRAEALWLGAVVASVVPGDAVLDSVAIAHPRVGLTSELTLGFSDHDGEAPTSTSLPVACPILIRAADLSVSELLFESRQLQAAMPDLGIALRPTPALPLRQPSVVVWIVPDELFEDTDWPGSDRASRRAAAGRWLAREGIALVVPSPS